MSISADNCNTTLFSKLTKRAQEQRPYRDIPDAPRWISVGNDRKEELELLESAHIVNISESPKTSVMLVKSGGDYIFLYSPYNTDIRNEIFEKIDLRAWQFLLFSASIRSFLPLANKDVGEAIAGIHKDMPGEKYEGHEWNDIASLFPPVLAMKVSPDALALDAIRLHALYIISEPNARILDFDRDLQTALSELVSGGPANVPYDNVLQAVSSSLWKHAFLDLYRCIEALYAVSHVDRLKREIDYKGATVSLVDSVMNSMGWTPNERSSVKDIFSLIDDSIIQKFRKIFSLVEGECPSGNFYNTRNEVVHLKIGAKKYDISNIDWQRLLEATCLAIEFIYKHYEDKSGCFK